MHADAQPGRISSSTMQDAGGGFRRLDIDIPKMDSLMEKYGGADVFGGGFVSWMPVTDCKAEIDDPVNVDVITEEAEALLDSRQPAGMLTETFNHTKLHEGIDSGSVSDPEALLAYAQGSRRLGEGMAARDVQYYRKHGIHGRRFANRPAGQWMQSSDKKAIFTTDVGASVNGEYIFANIDIDNCFVSLLYNELSENCDVNSEYPVLAALDKHYKSIRNFLAEYMSIPVKEAKREIIRIVHFGLPKIDLPVLWNLAVEMRRATATLLGLEKFSYLTGLFASRRNPMATKLHYALASIEDDVLSDMEQACQQVESLTINTYMFDGAIVYLREADVDHLRRRLEELGRLRKIGFTVEFW